MALVVGKGFAKGKRNRGNEECDIVTPPNHGKRERSWGGIGYGAARQSETDGRSVGATLG
jgi:hypothetical protein